MTFKPRTPSVTLDDLYNNYCKEITKEDPNFITKKEFKKASKLIFNGIVSEVLAGKRYNLPFGLGVLYLDSFKLKGNKVDFGATRKVGKVVYHQNLHSDGRTYKLKWDKFSNRFKNKKLYKFKLTRTHSRNLCSLIKQNKIKIFKYYGS